MKQEIYLLLALSAILVIAFLCSCSTQPCKCPPPKQEIKYIKIYPKKQKGLFEK